MSSTKSCRRPRAKNCARASSSILVPPGTEHRLRSFSSGTTMLARKTLLRRSPRGADSELESSYAGEDGVWTLSAGNVYGQHQ